MKVTMLLGYVGLLDLGSRLFHTPKVLYISMRLDLYEPTSPRTDKVVFMLDLADI